MVTILVGPQGSGKSTYAASTLSTNIISQDLMGQKGHMEAYKKALEGMPNGKHIVIDRINHTREQRRRYTELAKRAGHTTQIIVMNQDWNTCMQRIVGRTGHPTINSKEVAVQALRTYFSQYERPDFYEADFVTYSTYDPYLLDLNNIYPAGTRFIVIGDVHGCYDELMELLGKLKYRPGIDVLVFCGDLIDRGPQIDKVLQFVMTTPRVHSVMGNHENKLARHMANLGAGLASKVKIGHGLQNTIDQTVAAGMFDDHLMGFLWGLPRIIKFGKSYVFHAGINPRYSILRQDKEFLLYARKFNATLNTFDDENSPYWYEHDLHESYKGHNLFFGHEVHEIVDPLHFATFHKNKNVFPMDGGCVFGSNLLGAAVQDSIPQLEFQSVPSRQPKGDHEPMYETWSEPYEERVKAGYLSKAEDEDLVLYNYTDKCTFEKKWDKYTLECRGLIFEKATGIVVARPFGKFFNLGETENTQLHNLPNESYSCFEKMDGSLGIVFWHKNKWRVATRGSLTSVQAKEGEKILQQYKLRPNGHDVGANVTLLTEIVYPENRHNAGARLVIDYGNTRMLVLLAAYCSITGNEFSREDVEGMASRTGMPLVAKFDHTIEQMIEMQKTLPADKEGFVVRFESGMRIKIKGAEYMRMHKILNSITPLVIWEMMLESKEFAVPSSYMVQIPEEYRDEVFDIVFKLKKKLIDMLSEVGEDFQKVITETKIDILHPKPEDKKTLGLFLTKGPGRSSLRHPSMMFPAFYGEQDKVEAYCRKMIRPTSNQL